MKPIDELVALLEESGEEFEFRRESMSFGRLGFAKWGKEPDEIDGVRWKFKATEMPGDALMFHVTADTFEEVRSAIEATLGRGTCRRMPSDDATVMVRRGCFEVEFPFFECSECGSYVMDNARYCPICGAKVVG